MKLIHGLFDKEEALDLITKMVDLKIRYHEKKIDPQSTEEDTKMRENRIKQLQRDLYLMRQKLNLYPNQVDIDCELKLG